MLKIIVCQSMGYYFEIFLAFFSFLLFSYYFCNKNGLPTNWPLVGMLPALLINLHRINEFYLEIVEKSNLTFLFKGPWFTNMQLFLTVDPAHVHHIMSKNFINYPKGSKFNEIFDVLGDGIFNTDSDLWQYHRKMAQSFFGHPDFHQLLVKKIWEKVEVGLIPVLDYVSKQGLEVDLQDLFERFTFDTICNIIMAHDPKSLCIELPSVPASKALDDVEEVFLYRYAVPNCIWKFQRWLGVGLENKYKKAWEILDDFIYRCISKREEEIMSMRLSTEDDNNELVVDLLTLYKYGSENSGTIDNNDHMFLRDTILNFFIAGRDTTSSALSWFFYLLAKNPHVLSNIKEELNMAMTIQERIDGEKGCYNNYLSRNFKELSVSDKLVYLHGALCEALRLYPPVVFEAKSPIEHDILPSGHQVEPNQQIIFNLYAMGRMKSIWGDDCYEFKPERWISRSGKIKHEPSYKFMAFNAGPRTCLGKTMAFIQMKAVATTIIKNYQIQPVEGYPVVPAVSIILHMKDGFKVNVLTM